MEKDYLAKINAEIAIKLAQLNLKEIPAPKIDFPLMQGPVIMESYPRQKEIQGMMIFDFHKVQLANSPAIRPCHHCRRYCCCCCRC